MSTLWKTVGVLITAGLVALLGSRPTRAAIDVKKPEPAARAGDLP